MDCAGVEIGLNMLVGLDSPRVVPARATLVPRLEIQTAVSVRKALILIPMPILAFG